MFRDRIQMKTVLVTGLIGSGKSALCSILSRRGYPVYDSDSRTKALYECVPGLKEKIEETLGIPFGELGIIFRDAARREALESLVHPLVIEDFRRFALESGAPTVVFESAVACSKPLFRELFDLTVLVRADYPLRLQRNPKAEGRNAIQSEPQEPDYIIENNSDLAALEAEADKRIEKLNL